MICGSESTGKTTLVKRLADHFNMECKGLCRVVNETARELVPDSNELNMDLLLHMAQVHAERIFEASRICSDGGCL